MWCRMWAAIEATRSCTMASAIMTVDGTTATKPKPKVYTTEYILLIVILIGC